MIVQEQRKSGPLFLNRDRQKAVTGTAEIDAHPRFLFIPVEPQKVLVRVVTERASNPRKGPHKMTLAASKDAFPSIALDQPVVGGSATDGAGSPCPTLRVDQARSLSGGHVQEGPQQAATDQDLRIRIIESGRKERSAQLDRLRARLVEGLEETVQTLPEPEDRKGIEPDVLDSQERLVPPRVQRGVTVKHGRGNNLSPLLSMIGIEIPEGPKLPERLRRKPLRGRQRLKPAGNFGEGRHQDPG
jgi:hypothetical protein